MMFLSTYGTGYRKSITVKMSIIYEKVRIITTIIFLKLGVL